MGVGVGVGVMSAASSGAKSNVWVEAGPGCMDKAAIVTAIKTKSTRANLTICRHPFVIPLFKPENKNRQPSSIYVRYFFI